MLPHAGRNDQRFVVCGAQKFSSVLGAADAVNFTSFDDFAGLVVPQLPAVSYGLKLSV
jgi:hypothetical protein